MDIAKGRMVGQAWLEKEGVGEANRRYAPLQATTAGWGRPSLHLEDVSAIPFVDVIPGVEQYQHRARVRATDGELFAAVTPIPGGYEAYCEELGLGRPSLVMAEPVDSPMAVTQACRSGAAFETIVKWANAAGDVHLHPYMAISEVWELARDLARAADSEVRVVGPMPPVLWIANDKWSLHRIITEICGPEWLADSRPARTHAEAVAELSSLAERFDRVGLKRTRCASAMGNRVYDSEVILSMTPEELTSLIDRFAAETEWTAAEEVIAVEWIDAIASPSTQVWIPPLEQGDPVVEGVYEQILKGAEKVFVGSRPSLLGDEIDDAISRASRAVSAAFQELGYVGRCSFDFIIGRTHDGVVDARFTECNGRWGGTSTPMHLVDRLFDERPPYVAQDWQHDAIAGMTFSELRASLEDLLWTPSQPDGRFILYNVGPLKQNGKFDVISLGKTPEEAWEGTQEVLLRRLVG